MFALMIDVQYIWGERLKTLKKTCFVDQMRLKNAWFPLRAAISWDIYHFDLMYKPFANNIYNQNSF